LIGEPSIPNSCKNWKEITNTEIDWVKIFSETKENNRNKTKMVPIQNKLQDFGN
jgi:hypothetical protein